MALLSLTTHFTVSIDDDDAHVVTGGSTSTADTFTINYYEDNRITVAGTTLVTLWNDDSNVSNFDFLWIESDVGVEIQLLCNENGVITTGSDGDLENGFVIKLASGIPFILSSDDSRNRGDVLDDLNIPNYATEMDNWETTWIADTIDRIECYNPTGGAAKVRCFVAT